MCLGRERVTRPIVHQLRDRRVVVDHHLVGSSGSRNERDCARCRACTQNRVVRSERLERIRKLSFVVQDDPQIRLIEELERTPSLDLDTKLPALGRLIEVHIRKEERGLFQAIQNDLNPVELDKIGEKLAVHDRVRGDCRLDRVEKRKTV